MIAFSTSGWSANGGTGTSSAASSARMETRQAVAQAHALEVQIALHEIPLAGQRDEIGAALVHPLPESQQVPEPLERAFGLRRVAPDETEKRVEHVQDEVRVELRAEQVELGARAQDVGAGRAILGLAQGLGRVPRVSDPDQGEVDQGVDDRLPRPR